MGRRGGRGRAPWAAGLLLLALCGACGSGGDRPPTAAERDASITVGSFNFDESELLGEVYAQALEGAGLPVDRQLRLGSRELVAPAVEQGLVDVVPEYVGSALAFLAPAEPAPADGEEGRRALQEVVGDDVAVLLPASAQDQNGFVVRRETAEDHGLRTISDLAPIAGDLVFGGPPECEGRRLCLGGLREVYGLEFAEFRPLDSSGPLTLAALLGGRVDVALLFTTDGTLAGRDLVLLEDDRGLQPAENIVPIVRRPVIDRHGAEVTATLDAVTAELDTSTLISLNGRIGRGESVEAVAAAWLESEDLV